MSLSEWEYRFLKKYFPRAPDSGTCSEGCGVHSRLRLLLGDDVVRSLRGKVVVDFGCGEGNEAIDLAQSGAARVIGVDIRESVLAIARRHAEAAGVSAVCEFTTTPSQGHADAIISIDAFEHFPEPATILTTMRDILKTGGKIFISFGPPWLHPIGGHLFSVFPWAHLILNEAALIRWRSDFKSDGASRFGEVEGGLNQMTIGRFERLARTTEGLKLGKLEAVPIRSLRWAHNYFTREFTTSIVRCELVKV